MSAFRSLANSYLAKARVRRQALDLFWAAEDYSDVVREAQEIVELATKGILRAIGVAPPKRHDVADLLNHYEDRLPKAEWARLAAASKWLRTEREFSFHGDMVTSTSSRPKSTRPLKPQRRSRRQTWPSS